MVSTQDKDILDQIKKVIIKQDPQPKAFLFGSRAKGNTHKHSDWDILILLKKDKINLDLERNFSYPLYDLEFEIGQIISPMVYSEKVWYSVHKNTTFFENIIKDAVAL